MNNKILVTIKYPNISQQYDVFIPVNKKVKNVISLIQKAIIELNIDMIISKQNIMLVNSSTNTVLDLEKLVIDSDIKQGDVLILI